MREVVENVRVRLDDPKAIFRDSLINNVSDLIGILGALNIEEDPKLDFIRNEMQALVKSPVALRSNDKLRAETAAKAEEILANMPWK